MNNVRDLSAYDKTENTIDVDYVLKHCPKKEDPVERHWLNLSFLNTGKPVEYWKPSFFCYQLFRFFEKRKLTAKARRWHSRAGKLYARGW